MNHPYDLTSLVSLYVVLWIDHELISSYANVLARYIDLLTLSNDQQAT
jgi:hypothetical protein